MNENERTEREVEAAPPPRARETVLLVGANPPPTACRRPPLTLNKIRQRAFQKWLAAGKPATGSARFWLEAEQELLGDR